MPGSRSPPTATSSRGSSVKKSPTTETSYAFLNFSHPADAKDQKARRTVRSHVTKQQHQKEQLATAAAKRSLSMPQPLQPTVQPIGRTHASSYPLVQRGMCAVVDQYSPVSPESSPGASTSSSSSMTPLVQLDPRQLYPMQWIPYISIVLDHYIASMTSEILNSQHQYTAELLRTMWMPVVFTDTALLHTTLLVATSSFVSHPGLRPHSIDVLQLKGMAISAINESLQNPTGPVSDQIIGAVLSMAQYEAFWGDAEAFRCHMRALQNMIQMRGGLTAIGLPLQGFMERLILAVDYHAARATGGAIFFDPNQFPSNVSHPALIHRRDSSAMLSQKSAQ